MIELSSNVSTLLANKDFMCFYTLRIYDSSGNIQLSTTINRNITLSDGYTYLADNKIKSLDPMKISTTVDRESFKIVLADPDFSYGTLAENGLVGKSVVIRLCFYRISDETILTDIADTIISYAGRIDEVAFQVDTAEYGESLLQLMCASPLADLDHKKGLFLSKEFIRSRNSDDSCCDLVYAGSGSLSIKWGRL